MLEVREDNARSFEELVLRYQNRLIALMRHLVKKQDVAEDLTQEVFLRVYRARKTYSPGSKFSTWIFTIANNVAINAIRSLSRRKEINLAPPRPDQTSALGIEQAALAASGLMPTRQLDKSELRQVVQTAIEMLNERQRMAVLLARFEHLSYLEIAEIMDLTPQAVKSLLSRARTRLREVLEPYLEQGSSAESPPVKE